MLQGCIHPAKPPFFVVFRDFNVFNLHKASVSRTHLPNCDFLFCFRREDTAWHFSEPRSTRSKCCKPLFKFLGPLFFAFFREFNSFHPCKATAGKAHLPNWYLLLSFCQETSAWYFSEPRFSDQIATRLYSCCQRPNFQPFCNFNDFYVHKISVRKAHLSN